MTLSEISICLSFASIFLSIISLQATCDSIGAAKIKLLCAVYFIILTFAMGITFAHYLPALFDRSVG